MLLHQIIKSFKQLTSRKIYGKYFHSICHHLLGQFRIVSGRLVNVEKEERQFKFISSTSNQTSNHHPEHIISNSIIRMQIHKREKVVDMVYADTHMDNICKQITTNLKNSCIPFELIEEHWKEYQQFLEEIADYLLDSTFWSENEFGVEFFDVSPIENSKKCLYHFRSSTIEEEVEEVSQIWMNVHSKCLQFGTSFEVVYRER